jgi:hypothetical protein
MSHWTQAGQLGEEADHTCLHRHTLRRYTHQLPARKKYFSNGTNVTTTTNFTVTSDWKSMRWTSRPYKFCSKLLTYIWNSKCDLIFETFVIFWSGINPVLLVVLTAITLSSSVFSYQCFTMFLRSFWFIINALRKNRHLLYAQIQSYLAVNTVLGYRYQVVHGI